MGHIQQIPGPQPGNGLHLGCRFHLKDADGISPAEHVIDRLIFKIDAGDIDPLSGAAFDQFDRFLHLRESAQGQKVDLHKSGIIDAVLVPLADIAPFDGAPLHRHDIYQRSGG